MKKSIFLKLFFGYLTVSAVVLLLAYVMLFPAHPKPLYGVQTVDTGVRWLQSLALVGLTVVGFAYFLARSFSQPVHDLTEAADKVAAGNFNVRVSLRNKDELRNLADSFNRMTEEIRRLFCELTREQEKLKSIIATMPDAFVTVNGRGIITEHNRRFVEVFKVDRPVGKHYWEVVRRPAFSELASRTATATGSQAAEIEENGRSYHVTASRVTGHDDLMFFFHDVTELRNIENVKRDLIQNVSHELRTPLTAIKGFIETLEEDLPETHRRHVEIIHRNTDRLIAIVEDLLVLSRLEDRDMRLDREPTDIAQLVVRVASIFEHRAHARGIALQLQLQHEIPPQPVDPFRMEQVIINLLDNALKYTEQGAITVKVRVADDHLLCIDVIDTGIGISRENIGRIFERFYVVDKSRSRRLGGTGLGLSIVKHIVVLHGGTVEVESSPGSGSRFSVMLPYVSYASATPHS
jgi:two-component system phosphate regulon sensor histidine kinase PhoR